QARWCSDRKRKKSSRLMKLTWQGARVSAVAMYGLPEIVALSPSTSPGPAIRVIKDLPSLEPAASFTRPAQSIKMPRGDCPSTNSMAPLGKRVEYLSDSKAVSNSSGKSQK